MRYFFKHMWRTLRAFPLQPFLILLTTVLSVAVSVCAVRTEQMFRDHSAKVASKEAALGDLVISLRGDSEVRMLFCEDARELIGEEIPLIGEYALTAYYRTEHDGHLLSAAAVDLADADSYFLFSFTEYGRFTTQNLDRSVVLSTTAATEHGLHVGDEIRLRVLNEEIDYTVQAIAEPTGLLAERDLLLSITGAVKLLAAQAPEIAALGEDFLPYNRLMLRAEPALQTELYERLSGSVAFSETQIKLTERSTQSEYILFWQMNIIRLFAVLIFVLCAILIGTCLSQLRIRRTGEIALFCSIGASRKQLWVLQLMENAAYTVFGSVGGILLAIPMARGTGKLFAWQKTPVQITLSNALFGICLTALLLLGLSLPPLFAKRRELRIGEETEPEESTATRLPISCFAAAGALLLGSILCLTLPSRLRFVPGVGALLATIWLCFTAAPYLFRRFAALAERMQNRKHTSRPTAFLACRNLKNHPSVSHSTRLFTVLLLVLITLTACRSVLKEQIEVTQNIVQGELIAVSLPTDKEQKLREHPAVAGLTRFQIYLSAEIEDTYTVLAIAAAGDLSDCLHPDLLPKTPPSNGDVAVSIGIGELLDLQSGSRISLAISGVSHDFKVGELQRIQSPFVFLPCELVDANAPVCIRLHPEADETEVTELITYLESQGVMMTSTEEILGDFPFTLGGFLGLLDWTMVAAATVSLTGIANLLVGLYRARQKERHLLALCGATKKRIASVYAAELTALILFSALLAALCSVWVCLLLDRVLGAVGMTLFV